MQSNLTIGPDRIRDDSECYVIAEIGCNHMGDVEKAKDMFSRAKECGANAVKMQKRDMGALFTSEMYSHAVHQREQLRRDLRQPSGGSGVRKG